MSNVLKLKFDPYQPHQLQAIDSVVKLFDGFSKYETEFELGEDIRPNLPEYSNLEENWLTENLNSVQRQNDLAETSIIECEDGLVLEGTGHESWRYPTYTIEMETGTGKTYVYLRTIYELKKLYGFRKYIIIVPSKAIYEGVINSYENTREHFRTLYGNEPINFTQYDGAFPNRLRGFANSSFVEIMVMTIDSFNKKSNVFFNSTEKLQGELLPYQYIQQTRPILILDEAQNYLSDLSRAALRTMHPLFALRYSATPVQKHNMIYKLTPVQAFQQDLVKKIEVFGVTEEFNYNNPQLNMFLNGVSITGNEIKAEMKLIVHKAGIAKEEKISLKKGDDLFRKTNNENFKGLIVQDIDRENGLVIFDNQSEVSLNDSKGLTLSKQEIFRVQIEETVKRHIQRQAELFHKGIKVLTLFFIDRVANYMNDDGIIKKLFDEAFDRFKVDSEYFKDLNSNEVREAYFAAKKKKDGSEEFVDTIIEEDEKRKEDKELEKRAYELIMKSKERLLSFDEKVSFIFAHSALKEGWDNPNVFQICTLNETRSEIKKRQEIGRGMRLCVDQTGERIIDDGVNILTVIANESYESYVRNLQQEYVDSGDATPPEPSNARQTLAKRNDNVFNSQDFRDFWERLSKKTSYRIKIDSDEVIKNSVIKLNTAYFPEPHIVVTKGKFVITEFDISLEEIDGTRAKLKIDVRDTDDQVSTASRFFKINDDLAKIAKDERLRGLKIIDIKERGDESFVEFGNGIKVTKHDSYSFHSERGQVTNPKTVKEAQITYPVFNIIKRTSDETSLTRKTILDIFKGMRDDKKKLIFKNPEGFCSVFITTIRDVLANHIAEQIEYFVDSGLEAYDLESVFPGTKKYPQKELLDGTESSMYDKVQYDSDVEKRFIENRLKPDKEVLCYFKFPNAFKIGIPKIIGNYIPDWGIIRWDEEKKFKLQLVRETKGSMNPNLLQFPNEKRKIDCAKKHFNSIGIDYRQVTDQIPKWYLKENE